MNLKEEVKKAAEEFKNQPANDIFTDLEKEITKLGFVEGFRWALSVLYTEGEVYELMIKLKKDCIMYNNAQITNVSVLDWLNKNSKNEKDRT